MNNTSSNISMIAISHTYAIAAMIAGCRSLFGFMLAAALHAQMPVDPSVVISLQTRWHVMQPTKSFCEGAMLPLAGILDTNEHIK
jgi:hypothetical protein